MLWIRVLSPRWILGQVLGPDASSSLGVDRSLVSPEVTSSTVMDATMVTCIEPSLGYGAVVGRVTVPEA
jgi:hypothetical protein